VVRHSDRYQSAVPGYREILWMANIVGPAVGHQNSEWLKRLDCPQALDLLNGHGFVSYRGIYQLSFGNGREALPKTTKD